MFQETDPIRRGVTTRLRFRSPPYRACHILIFLSSAPEYSVCPASSTAMARTKEVWPNKVVHELDLRSHTLSFVSEPPLYRVEWRMLRQRTTPSWPISMCDFCIVLRFHTRILWSKQPPYTVLLVIASEYTSEP